MPPPVLLNRKWPQPQDITEAKARAKAESTATAQPRTPGATKPHPRGLYSVSRTGATISADTAAKLREIIAAHEQIIEHTTKAKAMCQALLDGNDQAEQEQKLERQWEHALH